MISAGEQTVDGPAGAPAAAGPAADRPAADGPVPGGPATDGPAPGGRSAGAPCAAGPRRGRPRSEAAEQSIIEAALQLLTRGSSLNSISIEGIAAQAGVGKATIYRRWPNKEELLFDVLVRAEPPEPEYRGGTMRDTLVQILEYLRQSTLAKRDPTSFAGAVADLRATPGLYQRYHDQVIAPRRARLHRLIAEGVANGELRDDVDVDLLGELIIGPMLSRAMLHPDASLDDPDLPAVIVDTVLQGIAPPTAGT